MRKIKFRAWDTKKQMITGSPFAIANLSDNYFLVKDYFTSDMWVPEKTSRLIPMQFTGLLDKNGKEIYEGDIVEWSIFPETRLDIPAEKRIRDVVGFGTGCFKVEKRCEILGLKEPYRKLEVIGNIYENPELLK